MKFYSTNDRNNATSFRNAVINSLPADNGLYFPSAIPSLPNGFVDSLKELQLTEVAFQVLKPFCSDDVPEDKLESIIQDTFIFDIPMRKVEKGIHCLELFHGPTMAFKDVGARFLARTLSYFQESENNETTILVATSGDTGGAVASGFYNQPGINVVILYPSGKVTPLQERQMTTLGGNIRALEVDGDFDDCQALVKQSFLDKELAGKMNLSSANSINIARWLPQSVYYYVPFMQLENAGNLTFSVPSGNYGNITSGMLAKRMGLPIKQFIAASNANDVVPRYLKSGNYAPKKTIATISNAMDVSKPSNFTRLQALHDDSFDSIIEETSGFSLDDAGTRQAIRACYESNGYIIDPHSAIAYQALKEAGEEGVFLGTAHYCKFLEVVNESIGKKLELPHHTNSLFDKEKQSEKLGKEYMALREYLVG